MLNRNDKIYCYFEPTDLISSFELIDPTSSFAGEVYLMCDNKHVLKYIRNPDGFVYQDQVSNTLKSLKDKYPKFFSNNVADDIMDHYNHALYFITTEYWAGAAYSIRTLLERLIYDNYGPYFFSEKDYLNFKTDKKELEKINSEIGGIGFQLFLETIVSENRKEKIKEVHDKIEKGDKVEPDESDDEIKFSKIVRHHDYLMEMINKIEDDLDNKIFLDKDQYKNFQTQYGVLSKGLHPREPIGSPEADKALNVVLEGYQSYFNNGNTWRVKYD